MKEDGLYFRDRHEWRSWLEGNGNSSDGIWMKMYKKHTGRKCVSYADAVEEALCFGWIDGKLKRIDDEFYIQYYTPRRPGSRWSKYNIDRVEKLKKEGRMTKAGLEAYNKIFKNPRLAYDNRFTGEPVMPDELMTALQSNKTAYENFMKFPQSARRMYIEWYKFAKQDKTKLDRIRKIVQFSKDNKRPGML